MSVSTAQGVLRFWHDRLQTLSVYDAEICYVRCCRGHDPRTKRIFEKQKSGSAPRIIPRALAEPQTQHCPKEPGIIGTPESLANWDSSSASSCAGEEHREGPGKSPRTLGGQAVASLTTFGSVGRCTGRPERAKDVKMFRKRRSWWQVQMFK